MFEAHIFALLVVLCSIVLLVLLLLLKLLSFLRCCVSIRFVAVVTRACASVSVLYLSHISYTSYIRYILLIVRYLSAFFNSLEFVSYILFFNGFHKSLHYLLTWQKKCVIRRVRMKQWTGWKEECREGEMERVKFQIVLNKCCWGIPAQEKVIWMMLISINNKKSIVIIRDDNGSQ